MRVFFSVGEPSGDLHGANLIRDLRALQTNIECVGYGGPKMTQAGCQLLEDLTQLAVMWVFNVLLNLHRFWVLLRRADCYFRDHQVDAVILIDYPGFNWWIARCAKRYGIPVFYYGVPQMWAWAPWRVGKMRRLVDHVICKLPFEADWYRQRGCHAKFVGHPYYDEAQRRQLDRQFIEGIQRDSRPLVTILPGSRDQEVTRNLRWLIRAAKVVRGRVAAIRFAVAGFNEPQAKAARAACQRAGLAAEVYVGRTPELIHLSRCCMACSGSVSLELLYYLKPTVILYQITRIGWLAQALLRRVRYITLVNLLATQDIRSTGPRVFDPDAPGSERVPFPEYLTYQDKSARMADHIIQWLCDDDEHRRRIEQLARLKERFCQAGASRRAAQYIVSELAGVSHVTRRPQQAA